MDPRTANRSLSNQVEIREVKSPVTYQMLKETNMGIPFCIWNFPRNRAEKNVELLYDVVRQEKQPYEDDSETARYLNPNLLMPVGDRFQVLADSIIGDKRKEGTLMQARALIRLYH